MTPREVYLVKSADLFAKAESERDPALKADFVNMARAYLQARRNDEADVVREAPPPTPKRDEA